MKTTQKIRWPQKERRPKNDIIHKNEDEVDENFMILTVRKVLVFPKNYSIYGFKIKTTKRIILQLSN